MRPETESFLKDLVLIVVDMQPRMLAAADPDGTVLRRTAFAVECATLLGIKVIFTEQVPDKLGHTAQELLEAAEQTGEATPYDVFPKGHFSVLSDPELRHFLQENGESHLILAGVETHICVYQSAVEAINQEMQVTLLTDCIGGRREDDGQWALKALASSGAILLPSETVFYSILRSADHPAFKPFTELVKRYTP